MIYLASQNAFTDFWDQAFLYNFVYIGKHEGTRSLIPVFIKGFAYLRNGWVLYFAILGWLAGFGYVLLKRNAFREIHPLILIALVDLPIEVLLITISGRSILHYYLTHSAGRGDFGLNPGVYRSVPDRRNSFFEFNLFKDGFRAHVDACPDWAGWADQKLSWVCRSAAR